MDQVNEAVTPFLIPFGSRSRWRAGRISGLSRMPEFVPPSKPYELWRI